MELLFLGRGAAFNPKEGNNSAYFIEDKKLFLIDCGESIFERIMERNLLEEIEEINLMITHTHSDHIGSIGSLLSYCHFVAKISCNIIINNDYLYREKIKNILSYFGCGEDFYQFVKEEEYDNKYKLFNSIRYKKTHHTDNMTCFSLLFKTNQGIIYYSGDSDDIKTIKELIDSNEEIYKLYVDSNSIDKDNGHLYIGVLDREIPYEYKNKIYCMHLNSNECIEMAKGLGFNVVEIKKIENIE